MDDPEVYRDDLRRATPTACSSWKAAACAASSPTMRPREFRGHHRRHLPLPSRAHGFHSPLYPGQARTRQASHYCNPAAGAHPRRDLRLHGLSGAGDADRAGSGRVFLWAAATWCAGPWPRKSTTSWRKEREILHPRHGGRGRHRWSCPAACATASARKWPTRSSTR